MTLSLSKAWLALVVLAFGLLFTATAFAAAPPANSVISNSARATYTDVGGASRDVNSNVVQTIVAQIYAVDLETPNNVLSAPGQQVNLPHTVTNNGNGTDIITINPADFTTGGDGTLTNIKVFLDANNDGEPDNLADPIATVTLDAGASVGIVVVATVPNTLADSENATLVVTAVSSGDVDGNPDGAGNNAGEVTSDENTDTVTVNTAAVINVSKSISQTQGLPNDTTEYTITLTYNNTGNADASNLVITDNLQVADTTADADALTQRFTYVGSTGRTSATGLTFLTDDSDGDEGGAAYDFNLTAAGAITVTIPTVPRTNDGNVTFNVTVPTGTVPGIIPNTATFAYQDLPGGGGDPQTGTTNEVLFEVLPSYQPDIDAGDSTGHNLDGNADTNNSAATVAQGGTAVFDHTITNDGTGSDTINVAVNLSDYPAGTSAIIYRADASGNRLAPLTDSNGDGIPDTGLLAADVNNAADFGLDSINIEIAITLPNGVTQSDVDASSGFDAIVTVTSVADPSETDTATDSVDTIDEAAVDLTNNDIVGGASTSDGVAADAAAANTQGAGSTNTVSVTTATTTEFLLFVNNTGPQSDSYNLLADDDGAFDATNDFDSLPGWSATFYRDNDSSGTFTAGDTAITNTGPIAAGGNLAVIAVISIPQNFPASDADGIASTADDEYEIYFRARSVATGVLDIKLDTVIIAENPSISITPNGTGQTFPGGSYSYQHTITNDGNTLLDAVNLGVANDNDDGFTTTLYLDLNGDGQADPGEPVISADTVDILGLYATTIGGIADLDDGAFNPGDQIPVVAVVNASNAVLDGERNTSDLTVDADSPAGSNVSDTANDITEVIDGDIQLFKEQALDLNCDGDATDTNEVAFTSAAITALQGAIPSACILYRVTAENSGTSPVTDLLITDQVPNFTTLETSCGAAQLQITAGGGGAASALGTDNVTPLADGGTGIVSADVQARMAIPNPFQPTQTAILTFCVQIDCSAEQIAAGVTGCSD